MTRDDNPRWLAVLVTALPVVLAAALVWSAPAARTGAERRVPNPTPVVAWTTGAEPEGTVRTP